MGDSLAFKFGYATGRTRFFGWLGGVAADRRRRGLARALMVSQHAWAKSHGYATVETGTTKDNVPMLSLNLSSGFEIIGTYARSTDPRVILQKRLLP
jgi:GNAT superfamily N-acetyltransferase